MLRGILLPFTLFTMTLSCFAVEPMKIDYNNRNFYNPTAYISSQCYTKTEGESGEKHNPCFACHRKAIEPNYTFDWFLQEELRFPEDGLKNPFTNLFKDRQEEIAKVSDSQILKYVREDNYQNSKGTIFLKQKLENVPAEWDMDKDGRWGGYTPDCYFNFDREGFDRTPAGEETGWRAFAYYPFLGTFWPTNGSTDDVLIRLDEPFRKTEEGDNSREVYKLNLAIIEALIKRENVRIAPVNEKKYDVDLDRDGKLGMASEVTYVWNPAKGEFMSYVGMAKELLEQKRIHLAAGLFPENTEFLHSVRYIDLDKNGEATMAQRMKELRYAKKVFWMSYFHLMERDSAADIEKFDWPDEVELFHGDFEYGMHTGTGWVYQGFIEDHAGELRPQSNEETLFCMGCHANLSVTADSTFVFQRKFDHDHYKGGWYHWSERGIKGVKEPLRKDRRPEYAHYLKHNGAGDEFRANMEVKEKFFDENGKLKKEALKKLRNDISYLLIPSKERALTLNKAYQIIVKEQSYIYGRDAVVSPAVNVHKEELEQDGLTGLEAIDKYYGVFSR